MSQEAVMSVPLSRPKIHRLPASHSRLSKKALPSSGSVVLALAAGLIAIAANHMMSRNYTSNPAMAGLPKNVASITSPTQPNSTEKDNSTIVIKGQDGTIVGQLARIPAQNTPITEVNTVSNVDKNTGRELLSIVNKY